MTIVYTTIFIYLLSLRLGKLKSQFKLILKCISKNVIFYITENVSIAIHNYIQGLKNSPVLFDVLLIK